MKTRAFSTFVGVAVCALTLCAAKAQPYDSDQPTRHELRTNQGEERYVVVTGSHIPRKAKVRSVGTNTADNVRIYGEDELRASGHATTERQLSTLDPSISVPRH